MEAKDIITVSPRIYTFCLLEDLTKMNTINAMNIIMRRKLLYLRLLRTVKCSSKFGNIADRPVNSKASRRMGICADTLNLHDDDFMNTLHHRHPFHITHCCGWLHCPRPYPRKRNEKQLFSASRRNPRLRTPANSFNRAKLTL